MQYLKTLFEAQKKIRSSDLHLYVGHPPYLRGADGGLYPVKHYDPLKETDTEHIAKTLMSQAQFEKFQTEKDFEFSAPLEEVARFRVNFYMEHEGIAVVFRMIEEDIPNFEDLGLPKSIENLSLLHYGLVLLTGPNGSGKSTTMAAMINKINETRNANIITIEEPIEFLHHSKKSVITQREVGTHIQSFHIAAKYLFRQDADVVVVGEMRDPESFSLALDIAETGHLVISTIHSEDVPSTISRIVNIFPVEKQNMIRTKLSLSLRGIVSQKLVPKKDYSGRVVATEVMIQNDATRHIIQDQKERFLYQELTGGSSDGSHTFDDSLLQLYLEGKIAKEHAVINSRDPDDFLAMIEETERKKNASKTGKKEPEKTEKKDSAEK